MQTESKIQPCLADSMHATDRLQFLCGVQDGFNQQHVCRFDQVQTIRTRMNRKKKHSDVIVFLEILQVGLKKNVDEIQLKKT